MEDGRLAGKIVIPITEDENYVSESATKILESISRMALNREQKSLLFVITQIYNVTNKKEIIEQLEIIKSNGIKFTENNYSKVLQNCIDDLISSKMDELSQSLIDFLNAYPDEEIFQ